MPGINPIPKRKNGQSRRPRLNMLWLYVFISLFLIILYKYSDNSAVKEVSIDKFNEYVSLGYVDKVVINRESAQVTGILTKQGAKELALTGGRADIEAKIEAQATTAEKYEDTLDKINAKLTEQGKATVDLEVQNGSGFMKIIWYFGPILLFVLLMFLLSRRMGGGAGGGGIFNVGKSRSKLRSPHIKNEK